MVAVPITTGRTPAELRALARRERDGRVSARLLALANALDGMSRDQAARAAGMDRQTLRDWVHRYNAEGVEGLRDRPRPGRPCALDEGQQAALKGLILRGPRLERDGCVAWRARDLRALVERRFGVGYSEAGVRLRIPTMSAGHSEPKSATCSDPSRPAVPIDVGRGGGSPAGRW
jgi:transposase